MLRDSTEMWKYRNRNYHLMNADHLKKSLIKNVKKFLFIYTHNKCLYSTTCGLSVKYRKLKQTLTIPR